MTPDGVEMLGLRVGDRVRFRASQTARRSWVDGTVMGLEKDGSVAVRDAKGAWRSLRPERLQAPRRGRRGGRGWESIADRAARTEQLGLW